MASPGREGSTADLAPAEHGSGVRRPRVVALLLLAMGLGNLGGAAMAVRYAAALPWLPMSVSWTYLAVMKAFWGAALTACGVALWQPRPWARWASLAAATLYQFHVWLNHLLFDRSDYAHQTRPRDLLLSGLFLLFVWGMLNWPGIKESLLRRAQKAQRGQK